MVTDKEASLDFDFSTTQSVFDLIFNKNPNNVPADTSTLISQDRTITFGELKNLVLKCAYNLKEEYGIEKGDVVAVRAVTHVEYPLVIHGTVCGGGTIALVKRSPEDDVETITEDLETVKPKLFIIDYEQRHISLQAAENAGIPKSNMLILGGGGTIGGIRTVQDVLLSGENLATPYIYTPDEFENRCVYLCYTSGSTGRRKAVTITPKTMLNAMKESITGKPSKNRVLTNRPFNFMSATYSELHVSVFQGDELYFSKAVEADEIYRDIEKFKITKFIAAPYIVNRMAKDESCNNYDLSSLDVVISVGAVITKSTIALVKERFGTNVINMYGGSEMFLPVYTTFELTDMGAVGRLNKGYIARIVDENDNQVDPGEPGELLLQGPTVTKGYFNNPEANKMAFTKDGFYRTGDIIACDKDGVLWFKSRSKNLMKYHSTHIYPFDIEKVVLKHPKVSDCAVIGVFSEELSTDLPRAYVSLLNKEDAANKEEIAQEILEFSNKMLHETRKIRAGVFIMDSLPRNLTGKILYGELKEEAEKNAKNNISVMETTIGEGSTTETIKKQVDENQITSKEQTPKDHVNDSNLKLILVLYSYFKRTVLAC
ncbi:acetyl-CoA synthetase-like protein [Backusella circina FSU 941]|nr:acetyl-CoA synthetase-like protein [Backusella circina FSU 941]